MIAYAEPQRYDSEWNPPPCHEKAFGLKFFFCLRFEDTFYA